MKINGTLETGTHKVTSRLMWEMQILNGKPASKPMSV